MAEERVPEKYLPRDEFTVRMRELRDNPGAVRTSSRVDIADHYGNHETWTVDTWRVDGTETAFVQRMNADGGLRLLLPPKVMEALARGHETLTGKSRSRAARATVEMRRERGDVLGNPDALQKARRAGRRGRRKAKKA